ncbi:MAG: DUF2188 domain-containing protein [Saprospiraceae bacterium]|nr:DUF2188 domain-containing protein [Saprospiraceae bacterium]
MNANFIKAEDRTKLNRWLRASAKLNQHRIFVFPINDYWGIKFEGSKRLYRKYRDKSEAIKEAKKQATKRHSRKIIVQNDLGLITSEISAN